MVRIGQLPGGALVVLIAEVGVLVVSLVAGNMFAGSAGGQSVLVWGPAALRTAGMGGPRSVV